MCQGSYMLYFSLKIVILIDFGWLGGDFLKGDGTGSFSIYGEKFPVRAFHASFQANFADVASGREFPDEAHRTRTVVDGVSRCSFPIPSLSDNCTPRPTQGQIQMVVKYVSSSPLCQCRYFGTNSLCLTVVLFTSFSLRLQNVISWTESTSCSEKWLTACSHYGKSRTCQQVRIIGQNWRWR